MVDGKGREWPPRFKVTKSRAYDELQNATGFSARSIKSIVLEHERDGTVKEGRQKRAKVDKKLDRDDITHDIRKHVQTENLAGRGVSGRSVHKRIKEQFPALAGDTSYSTTLGC